MSVPAVPAAAVTDANPTDAAKNAADDADKHTPNPPISNDPPAPAADPTDGGDKKDNLRELVTGLAESVAALQSTVAGLVSPDASPTARKPWTHRGGK